MLDKLFIPLDRHLITILGICIEEHSIFEWLSTLDLALIDSVVRILSHYNGEICDSLEKASTNIKVSITTCPSSQKLDDIQFHIALKMEIINHDDDFFVIILWDEYLLPLGCVKLFNVASKPINREMRAHRDDY